MAQTATTTAPLDRWDLIAQRLWDIPELGWAIAEANPDLAGYLVLPAGLPLVIPELRSLRRPLTAANPAREDDGEFPELPPDTPRPIAPPSGGGGSIVLPLAINQGGTGGVSAQDALNNLGAVALSAVGVSVAPLVVGLVPVGNLPPYPTLSSLGAIATSQRGVANGIAPLDSNSLVPSLNLPPYPTLTSLNAVSVTTFNNAINSLIPISAIGANNGVTPLDSSGIVPTTFLPPYPTLTSLGALAASSRGAADGVAPLDAQSRLPVGNLPATIPATNIATNAQFQLIARNSAIPINFNILSSNHAFIRWIDGNAGHTNSPSGFSSGSLIQYDPLFGVVGDLYKYQVFFGYNNKVAERHQSNGTWGNWNERAFLNQPQRFSSNQIFANGFNCTGGTPNLSEQNTGNISTGTYWFLPGNSTNQKLSDIIKSNNGNLILRQLSDNYATVLFQWQFTASGNLICPGMVQAASFATNPTPAINIPGGFYYNTAIGCMVYAGAGPTGSPSAGTVNWRRMDTNAIVT